MYAPPSERQAAVAGLVPQAGADEPMALDRSMLASPFFWLGGAASILVWTGIALTILRWA